MTKGNKLIAQKVLQIIGGNPKVIKYSDNNQKSKVDIFVGENRPYDGVTSYSTIGLSNNSIGLKLDNDKELRVEIIGASGSNFNKFGNIISSCAFNIINNNFACKPGIVYPNIVSEYYDNTDMKHILFTTPFLWGSINNLKIENKIVTWLMLIPISESEFKFLQKNGSEVLENLFEEKDIDIFDINRKSVI